MKHLEYYLTEKLRLDKNLIVGEYYEFSDDIDLKIMLPFTIEFPEIPDETTIKIYSIKKSINDWHESVWEFYDKQGHLIVKLSENGIKNIFIKQNSSNYLSRSRPLIYYGLTSRPTPAHAFMQIVDSDRVILKESKEEPTLYANVILLNPEEDKVLILKRANYMKRWKGMWGFPGGHVDAKDKDPKEAAIRELKEETGIELTWNEAHKLKEFDKIYHENDNSLCYYYITTLETDSVIKLSKEHSDYEWFNSDSKIKNQKWVPDVFQIIQKIL